MLRLEDSLKENKTIYDHSIVFQLVSKKFYSLQYELFKDQKKRERA